MIKYFQQKIFSKIALLFLIATLALVFSSYYVLTWEFVAKDTILDAHDAYHHYNMVENWNFDNSNDSNIKIEKELDHLHMLCAVYDLNLFQSMGEDCVFVSPLWQHNNSLELNICNYQSYNDSEIIDSALIAGGDLPINVGGYVSFGQLEIVVDGEGSRAELLEASVVEDNKYRYLLVVADYVPPNELFAFLPSVVLASAFMLALYLLIRTFLSPINIIQNRIVQLEKGDLDSTISIVGHDELALLSRKFNDLILQIKKLLNQKESLLSDVSHELRTPLAKIKLLLELAPTKINKMKINNQIEYLDSLVTNILIADKMSSPYSNLSIEEVFAKDLINNALEFARAVNISLNVQDNCLLSVDVVKMSVVFKNIIDNACKYAPSKEALIISSKKIAGNVEIAIKDFGPGISEKLLSTIMDPFVQDSKNKAQGFGLGLAISKKILKAHGGKLLVENNSVGCTFSLLIPVSNSGENHAKKQLK